MDVCLKGSTPTASVNPRPKPVEAPHGRWHPSFDDGTPMSYLASPYRTWGHPVTYKFAGES